MVFSGAKLEYDNVDLTRGQSHVIKEQGTQVVPPSTQPGLSTSLIEDEEQCTQMAPPSTQPGQSTSLIEDEEQGTQMAPPSTQPGLSYVSD